MLARTPRAKPEMILARSASRCQLPHEVQALCRVFLAGQTSGRIRSIPYGRRHASGSADSPPSSVPALSFPGLPNFPACGRDIELLHTPSEFYNVLLDGIRRAKWKIILAALYIGKEETEVIQALHTALKNNSSLELHIVCDALRSTREHPSKASSASVLSTLQAAFPKQVHISLYHTPALHGWLKRLLPQRYNEGLGLWHGKIYGFDENIILSGANLSKDYFTNRQDRYMLIRNHDALAFYMIDLLQTFRPLSYTVRGLSSSSADATNLQIAWEGTYPEPTKHPKQFIEHVKQDLYDFTSYRVSRSVHEQTPIYSEDSSLSPTFDTSIHPFLQMGQYGIEEETKLAVSSVLAEIQANANLRLDWTSGYFSLMKPYKDALLSAAGSVNVVCASPEANGFFQSPGFSKYLPPAYTYMEQQFWEAVKLANKTQTIRIEEWKRPGWTYHSKGIWLSQDPSAGRASDVDGQTVLKPHLTIIGSSNFGHRSAVRDVEVNAVVQTTSPELSAALGRELQNIRQHATDTVDDSLFKRKDRYVGPINRFAARAISDML